MRPLISVLLPVRNGFPYLPEAILSVLQQSHEALELLIVDDGSEDETTAYIRGLSDARLRILHNPGPHGLVHALNLGLAEARGTLVARMDADDICFPNRLQLQSAYLKQTGANICFGRYLEFGQGLNVVRRELPSSLMFWDSLFRNAYGAHPTVMFRRQTILDAGGYSAAFQHAEDYDLWDRCRARDVKFCHLPVTVLRYRRHAATVTANASDAMEEGAARVSERALLRNFPGLSSFEARCLRHLMLKPRMLNGDDLSRLLALAYSMAEQTTLRYGGGIHVLNSLSASLFRAASQQTGDKRQLLRQTLRQIAWKTRSPRLAFRWLRSFSFKA